MRAKPWLAFAVVVGLSAPLAAPTFADPASASSGASGAAAKTPPPPSPDDVICKRQEVTGSRLGGRKVCHTRLEWEQMSENARENLDTRQTTSLACQPGMGC